MDADVRWKQRFQNFDRACGLLADALKDGPGTLSLLEKEGVVQRFEVTFELAWKTLKDFLEDGGLVISPVVPRQVIKDAFAAKVLAAGQVWIDLLELRNKLSHTYSEAVLEKAVDSISNVYNPALQALRSVLAGKLAP